MSQLMEGKLTCMNAFTCIRNSPLLLRMYIYIQLQLTAKKVTGLFCAYITSSLQKRQGCSVHIQLARCKNIRAVLTQLGQLIQLHLKGHLASPYRSIAPDSQPVWPQLFIYTQFQSGRQSLLARLYVIPIVTLYFLVSTIIRILLTLECSNESPSLQVFSRRSFLWDPGEALVQRFNEVR